MKDLDSKLIYEAYNNSKQEDILLAESIGAFALRGLGAAKNQVLKLFRNPKAADMAKKAGRGFDKYYGNNPGKMVKHFATAVALPSIAVVGRKIYKFLQGFQGYELVGGALILIYLYTFLAKKGDKIFDKLTDDEKKSDEISPERLKELVQEVTEEDPEDSNLTIGDLEKVRV